MAIFQTEARHEPGNWHLDSDFNEAVRSFHNRNARQPIGKDMVLAKEMLEDLKV